MTALTAAALTAAVLLLLGAVVAYMLAGLMFSRPGSVAVAVTATVSAVLFAAVALTSSGIAWVGVVLAGLVAGVAVLTAIGADER